MYRNPLASPAQIAQLSLQTAQMLTEAQMVIGMRMLGMMGMWRVLPSENTRMSSEKIKAVAAAARASGAAMLAGKSPVEVASAALKPVRRRTGSNVKRLGKQGPGKPRGG